jgi:hypothetical protein
MELTALQTDLLKRLQSAVASTTSRRVVYCSEWLGYLPFGLYHWVNADGQDISLSLPCGWDRRVFEALEKAGLLAKIDEWKNPDHEYDTKITYEVPSSEVTATVAQPRE